MLPKAFLSTFWGLDLRPEVFVAMSFDPAYIKRFNDVFTPAIQSIEINGQRLKPYRVDLSRSGDSILSEIIDGIAHCTFFLADISMVDKGARSGEQFRNGNVMFEVGIALSCRNPSEILVIRDDYDKTLFDVSMVPHMHIDFTDFKIARETITRAINERLEQNKYEEDLRVKTIFSRLTPDQYHYIAHQYQTLGPNGSFNLPHSGGQFGMGDLSSGLLDKNIVRRIEEVIDDEGNLLFKFTKFGLVIAKMASDYMEKSQSLREN